MSSLRRLLAFAFLGLTVLAANALAQNAKVLRVLGNGTATVTRGGQRTPLTGGMALQQTDTIETSAGVEVFVQTYPGAVATIKANTTVLMERLQNNAATLDLKTGNLVSQIDPGKQSDYQVRTPRGVAAARGTVYVTTVNGINYSVSVLSGNVSVSPINPTTGALGTPVPVVGGSSSANGGNATALAANPDVGNIAAAALAAVAVAKADGALDAGASATLLNQTAATVVATGNTAALAQATAAAAAAAPSQAAAVVTAAVSSATPQQAAAVAQTTAQAAAQGAAQAAAQSAANGTTTAQGATTAAATSAQQVAQAAAAALQAKDPNTSANTFQQLANSTTAGAVAGLGNTGNGNNVVAQIAQQVVQGTNAGSGAQGNNQANVGQVVSNNNANNTGKPGATPPTTPITPIDPTINVSPSGTNP